MVWLQICFIISVKIVPKRQTWRKHDIAVTNDISIMAGMAMALSSSSSGPDVQWAPGKGSHILMFASTQVFSSTK